MEESLQRKKRVLTREKLQMCTPHGSGGELRL